MIVYVVIGFFAQLIDGTMGMGYGVSSRTGLKIFAGADAFLEKKKEVKGLTLLGFIGGFLDATGGGWGPVVTSSLVMSGKDAKKVIGSVNIVEFFVTFVQVAIFVAFFEDFSLYISMILSLIIGGVIAAPLGAVLCKWLPIRFLLVLMGILLIVLNVYTLGNYL